MMLSDSCTIQQEKPRFQVIFLGNDDLAIWIDEVDEIDFSEIRKHLESGGSLFITCNEENKLKRT